MWLMTRLAIVFYVSIIWITSLAVVLFVAHVLEFSAVHQALTVVYNDGKVGAIVAGISCGIIVMSFVLENLIYGRRRRERTIAFDNPGGPVAVSLSALEDLIKRLSVHMPEIKEIRPIVLAIKKGLDIDIKLTLKAEANIPDLTTRLQDLVRRKIEETIGMEGKINVRIHVVKISLEDIKTKRPVHINEPHVPFHGYRA
ncbi:MAG: alkaline shock response membrane anchor protein AmaP [Candidatus Omnitrophica bacterium]|nr:alkaline shock response membrane anchor protein AmaP [Candidatus Omnitrophota bacterium]